MDCREFQSLASRLTILDCECGAPQDGHVLWRDYRVGTSDGCLSIPALVESRSVTLRRRFLDWVHSIGEWDVGGRTIAQHLMVRPSLSYWWMTSASHAPNLYDAGWINDAIKCLALEEWIDERGYDVCIDLVSSNPALIEAISGFCGRRKITFSASAAVSARASSRAGQGDGRLSPWISPVAHAASIMEGSFRQHAHDGICVVDHLTYLDHDALKAGVYRSAYWGRLGELVALQPGGATWLHNFLVTPEIPSIRAARRVVAQMNATGSGTHILADSALGPRVVLRALEDWRALRAAHRKISNADWPGMGMPSGSAFDFSHWIRPLLARELRGGRAFRNCARLGMYERALSELPRQRLGLYILENQPWEMALQYAWRASGHGALFGVQHATVRYWDLRNFYSKASLASSGHASLPRPDAVLVNGQHALDRYSESGYPRHQLLRVEAARYLHLSALDRPVRPRHEGKMILVCGDNVPGSNERLCRIIESIVALLPSDTRFAFRSHPALRFELGTTPSFVHAPAARPLVELIGEACAVVTGQTTSVSAEAISAGRRVAVFRDGSALNTSPMFGTGVDCFFSTGEELMSLLSRADSQAAHAPSFFDLDPRLPAWQAVFRSQLGHASES